MASKASKPPPPAAFCEDFNEDANTTLPETRKVANVAAKRSKPELANVKSTSSADGASDSGYSSRTAATVGSGDSIPKDKKAPVALKVDTTVKDRDGRPPLAERKTDSSQRNQRNSSRSAPQRSTSKTRRPEYVRHAPGTCMECDQRGYHVSTPLESPRPTDYPPRYNMPPSPVSARYPPPMMYTQEVYTAQVSQLQPRLNRSQSYRSARPTSFHGGIMQDMYLSTVPPLPYDRGPPPSASAWANTPTSYGPPPYIPPQVYVPTHVAAVHQQSEPPPPSPYDQPRPRPRPRASTQHTNSNRRASMYGAPVVEHVQSLHSAAGPPMERKSSEREHRHPPPSTRYDQDEDFYRSMPATPLPTSQPQVHSVPLQRRPCVRKSTTTNSIPRPPPIDMTTPDRSDTRAQVSERSPRKEMQEPASVSRRPSVSGKKATSYTLGSGSRKISVEDSRSRRKTVYGHERPQDLEQKQRDVLAYQETKGTNAIPLTADALKKARRGHRVAESDSGSQKSRTTSSRGSDTKTKSGSGAATRSDGGIFSMTIEGVKLDFNAEQMEGKTINVRPKGEERGIELSIGAKTSKRYSISSAEYARRKEIDDGRGPRADAGSDRASTRSSQSGFSRRGSGD